MAKRFLFLKVRHPYSSICRLQYLPLYIGSALIQACEAAGAAIPRCIHSWPWFRLAYSRLISRSVSATTTDLQSRATVGEHRSVYYSFVGEFLTDPRMCLVEVERSPKPVASWYFQFLLVESSCHFWSTVRCPRCLARRFSRIRL